MTTRRAADDTIVIHQLEKSSMYQRTILPADDKKLMPPRDKGGPLAKNQIEILKQWIARGAAYQQHWSFEPPIKPEVPAGKNGADALVQKRLAEIGFRPSLCSGVPFNPLRRASVTPQRRGSFRRTTIPLWDAFGPRQKGPAAEARNSGCQRERSGGQT